MVFLGTSVTGGSARAVVVNTGMETELGRIAKLLESAESGETPLQRQLERVGRLLLMACFGIVGLIFGLGLWRGIAPFELFLSSVSLAVAAIPEGLPAVVTIALALGVQRMVQRHALVRRLASVETLGRAQVICTDKTGTLTMGEMTARKLVTSKASIVSPAKVTPRKAHSSPATWKVSPRAPNYSHCCVHRRHATMPNSR